MNEEKQPVPQGHASIHKEETGMTVPMKLPIKKRAIASPKELQFFAASKMTPIATAKSLQRKKIEPGAEGGVHETKSGLTPFFSPSADFNIMTDSVRNERNKNNIEENHCQPVLHQYEIDSSDCDFTSRLLASKQLGAPAPKAANLFSPIQKSQMEPEENSGRKALVVLEPDGEMSYLYENVALSMQGRNIDNYPDTNNDRAKDEYESMALANDDGGMTNMFAHHMRISNTNSHEQPQYISYIDLVMAKKAWAIKEPTEHNRSNPVIQKAVLIDAKLMAYMNAAPSAKQEVEEVASAERDVEEVRCLCKKSSCLRLYCECFAASQSCDSDRCDCKKCKNRDEHDLERQTAIQRLLARKPNAFSQKRPTRQEKRAALLKNGRTKFCNCAKTKCLKMYCDCFVLSLHCSSKCKCVQCENKEGSSMLQKKRQLLAKRIRSNREL